MKRFRTPLAIATLLLVAAVFPAATQPAGNVSTAPVYVPDYSHQNDPLPPGVLAWDETSKTVDATNGQDYARFVFAFTNVLAKISTGQATNVFYVTNYTIVTNSSFWQVFSGHKYSAVPHVSDQTNVVTVTNSVTLLPVTVPVRASFLRLYHRGSSLAAVGAASWNEQHYQGQRQSRRQKRHGVQVGQHRHRQGQNGSAVAH